MTRDIENAASRQFHFKSRPVEVLESLFERARKQRDQWVKPVSLDTEIEIDTTDIVEPPIGDEELTILLTDAQEKGTAIPINIMGVDYLIHPDGVLTLFVPPAPEIRVDEHRQVANRYGLEMVGGFEISNQGGGETSHQRIMQENQTIILQLPANPLS